MKVVAHIYGSPVDPVALLLGSGGCQCRSSGGDEEYDQLSRVDTTEREDADREFSTFDQGPLADQPAFVPEDSPVRKEFAHEEPKFRANHQSTYSAMTVPVEDSDEDEPHAPIQNAQDRWAQIRKNAADRARKSEEQTTRSRTETRTDDGETSGEESKSHINEHTADANI